MKYTKNNVMKKRNQLSSEQIRKHSKVSLFLFKYLLIAAIALIAAFLGLSVGYVRGILKTTPQITKESVHSKGHTTTIYDKEGKKLSTLPAVIQVRSILLYPKFLRICKMPLSQLKTNDSIHTMELIFTEQYAQPSLI